MTTSPFIVADAVVLAPGEWMICDKNNMSKKVNLGRIKGYET